MSHLGDRLSALIDGELGGAERDRAYAHLAGCELCRTEAAELRALKKKLSGLLSGAPAEAAMTRRLIAMTGPGGPLPPRRRLLRLAPGGAAARRETRRPRSRGSVRRRYLLLGTVSLVVGLGTAAFTAGGSGEASPGPRITPPVEMYSVEHAIITGEVPFTGPSGRPRGHRWSALGRPNREVGVFAFNCPVSRRREARPAPLLAAVLAVAVPGFLVTACSGPSGASPDGVAASASSAAPGAAATANAPVRRPASVLAAHLLTQAAEAAVLTSYQGEEIVSHWGTSGGTVLVSDIWHVSGGQTITQTLATGTNSSSEPYLSSDTDGQWPEGVLGVTTPLVSLLESHYVVVYAGTGEAGNRAAQIVEAWRDDGSLAAKFWLDNATKLPLERQVFDTTAHVISEDVFINVRPTKQPTAAAPNGGPSDPQGPWAAPLSARQLLALRAYGWLVPAQLPGGLSLFAGTQTRTATGTVLDLGYSDGLSVVSLFEQRGNLAAKLVGWQKITMAGKVIYAAEPDQRSLTWSGRGMVYTVVADAPAQTVNDVIKVLPHDHPPGFWKRISHGFARLASWVNPFR